MKNMYYHDWMNWMENRRKRANNRIDAYQLNEFPYEIDIIAENLSVPWAVDVSDTGVLYFTERSGNIRRIENGILQPTPLITLQPPFISQGEGGLMGLALDPEFYLNHYIYVIYTYAEGNQSYNRVVRLVEENNKAYIDKVLLDFIPGGQAHNGGRLKVGPDNKLYITTGDAGNPSLSGDLTSMAGKILRIELDGGIPADNPIPNSPVYSYGLRNPQGITWKNNTMLYATEHGASGHDEINIIQPGGNYGWPLVQGNEDVKEKNEDTKKRNREIEEGNEDTQEENKETKKVYEGIEEVIYLKPLIESGEGTWAPSGIAYIKEGPWQGKMLVAALRGQELLSFSLNEEGTQVLNIEPLFQNEYGRIRDVVEGKDGFIYLTTSNMDGRGNPLIGDDKILRLIPKNR